MSSAKPLRPLEVVVLAALAAVSLVGLLGTWCALASRSSDGGANAELVPLCLGPVLAAASSMAMIALRNRLRPVRAPFVAAVGLWFVGLSVLSSGITAAALYEEPGDFTANLQFAGVFCLAPGALLALVGLALYVRERRRSRRVEDAALAPLAEGKE